MITKREFEMSNEDWLSVEETAEILGICRMTLFRYIREDKISSHKNGNRRQFRRSELQEFMATRVRTTRTQYT